MLDLLSSIALAFVISLILFGGVIAFQRKQRRNALNHKISLSPTLMSARESARVRRLRSAIGEQELRTSMDNRKSIPDVFLCHSQMDKPFVRQLARDLHDLSIYAWFDEWELKPGESLHGTIGKAIETSSYVVVVVSPESNASVWCRKELAQALARESRLGRPFVIPAIIETALVPAFLEDKVYVDFRADYLTPLLKLAGHIRAVDLTRLSEAIQGSKPDGLYDVKQILHYAGWNDSVDFGAADWYRLTDLLGRHGIDVEGDRLSIFDPESKKHHDLA